MSKFSPKNLTVFKLNGIEYALYNHIIADWAIFNVFKDCDVKDMLELVWNINPKNVDIVFSFICEYDLDVPSQNEHVSVCVEIISFMRYIGISEWLIFDIVSHIIDDKTWQHYIDESCTIKYDDCILFVFDIMTKYRSDKLAYRNEIFEKIKNSSYPVHAKMHILKEIIPRRINRLMYENHVLIESSCKNFHHCSLHPNCHIAKIHVAEIYNEYGFDIESLHVHRNLNNFVEISIGVNNMMINYYPNEKGSLDIARTVFEHILSMTLNKN